MKKPRKKSVHLPNRRMDVDEMAPFGHVKNAFNEMIVKTEGKGRAYDCIVCGQNVKIYKRNVHAEMAYTLIVLYKFNLLAAGAWVPVKELYTDGQAGDYAKLRHWGLAEPQDQRSTHTNASGHWRITRLGCDFVEGGRIPKYAHVYANILIGKSGPDVTIGECLSKKFNFTELMAR